MEQTSRCTQVTPTDTMRETGEIQQNKWEGDIEHTIVTNSKQIGDKNARNGKKSPANIEE